MISITIPPKEYGCALCKYKCTKPANLKHHFTTQKHLRFASGLAPKAPVDTFHCEPCGFSCSKKADYTRHKHTQKHIIELDSKPTLPNTLKEEIELLNTHPIVSSLETMSGVVLQMVKQNAELQRLFVETQIQTQKQYGDLLESHKTVIPTTTIHHTHTTNTTNHFNLQVFLNVKCKDAINMSDFIRSLDIQKEDIDRFGSVGFTEGITRIFMNGLNELETHKRPIHCTDIKRDIMYIKDSNQWAKDHENARLMRAIETVEQTNCRLFCKTAHPSMENAAERERYMMVLQEVNGGTAREKNRSKIVKNISKACFVDRTV